MINIILKISITLKMTTKNIKEISPNDKYLLSQNDKINIHCSTNMNAYLNKFKPYVESVNVDDTENNIHIIMTDDYEHMQNEINNINKGLFRRILIVDPKYDIMNCFIFKINYPFGDKINSIGNRSENYYYENKQMIINELKIIFSNTFVGFDFHILEPIVLVMKYGDFQRFINEILKLYKNDYHIGIIKLITAKYYNNMIFRTTTLLNMIIKKIFPDKNIEKVEQTWGKVDNIGDINFIFLTNFLSFLEMMIQTESMPYDNMIFNLDKVISGYPDPMARTYFGNKLKKSLSNFDEDPDLIY